MALVYLLTLIIGLCIGSFFNVVLYRLYSNQKIAWGRSACPHCHTILRWYDLVPLLSFLFLRGHCRYCHGVISYQYPIVELLTGIVLVGAMAHSGFAITPNNLVRDAVILGLLLLALFDWKYYLLPDVVMAPVLAGAVFLAVQDGLWRNHLASGLLLALFFGILYVVSAGRWIGFGDVKLVFVLGIILGYPLAVIATFASIWSAAIVGLLLMLLRKATHKTLLPLGTFLASISIIIIILRHELYVLTRFF